VSTLLHSSTCPRTPGRGTQNEGADPATEEHRTGDPE